MIGLSISASFAHKDILKLARSQLADRSQPVRSAAAKVSTQYFINILFIYLHIFIFNQGSSHAC